MTTRGQAEPDLTIGIVNWNTRSDLEQALASVFSAPDAVRREVVVVDNASTDGSPEMVRRRFPAAALVVNARNVGFARAHNQTLRAGRGRHFLLLNSDAVVHPGALEALVRFLDDHPRAAGAGPRLLNPDGSLQYSCRRFPTLLMGLFRNTPLGRLFPHNRFSRGYLMADWDHRLPREVDWLSGAAVCLRREALAQVGLLDEGYYMYCEDMDWCYRAHRAGWQIYYVPAAVVTHVIGRSSDLRPVGMALEFHRSMARFYRKHYARRYPVGLRGLPLLGIGLRALVILLRHELAAWQNHLRPRSRG